MKQVMGQPEADGSSNWWQPAAPESWPSLLPEAVLPHGSELPTARAVLQARATAKTSATRPIAPSGGREPQCTPLRAATARSALSPIALRWLHDLPASLRPSLTAERHPHVVNQLALVWDRPAQLRVCLRELLLADRHDRQGFAFEVLAELAALQAEREDTTFQGR